MRGLRGALAFLTRLPLRCKVEDLGPSLSWYAFVGGLIGLVPTLILWRRSDLFGAFWAAAFLWLQNGGLHLDGLADSCDALFSGAEGEKFLTVLKDSRLGTFGALGLMLVVGGNWVALTTLAPFFPQAVVLTTAAARALPPLLLRSQSYVGQLASPHASQATTAKVLVNLATVGLFFALCAPFTFSRYLMLWLVCALISFGVTLLVVRRLCTKGGGLRGDFLGCGLELFQTLTLTLLGVMIR